MGISLLLGLWYYGLWLSTLVVCDKGDTCKSVSEKTRPLTQTSLLNTTNTSYETEDKYCTRQPNMNYALRGLDLPALNPTFGNDPDGSSVVSEPGVRFQIFEDQGSFIQAIEQLICTAEAKETFYGSFDAIVDGWTHMSSSGYDLQLGNEVSVEIPVPGMTFGMTIPPMFTRGTSESEDASGMDTHFNSAQGSVANTRATCSIYRVNVDIYDSSLVLHPGLVDAIRRLDTASQSTDETVKRIASKKFVEEYGQPG